MTDYRYRDEDIAAVRRAIEERRDVPEHAVHPLDEGHGPVGVEAPITQYQNFEQLELAGQDNLAPGYEKLFKLISRVGREVTAPCA